MREKTKKEPFEDASLEELEKMKEVKFEIDKGAWDGPVTCCRRKTIRAITKTNHQGKRKMERNNKMSRKIRLFIFLLFFNIDLLNFMDIKQASE